MFKVLAILSFFLVSMSSIAQDFKAGLRGGIVGSQVNGDRLSGFDKGGPLFGGFVNRKLPHSFSAQMEIVFIQKGSRKPTDEFNSFYLLRLNYIEVPVLLQFNLTNKLTLQAGPSFGTLISSHEENEFQVFNSFSQFKKLEIAANGGVIYKLSDHFAFDARYSASMSTIRPFPGVTTAFFDRGQYNIAIEFSLMYSF